MRTLFTLSFVAPFVNTNYSFRVQDEVDALRENSWCEKFLFAFIFVNVLSGLLCRDRRKIRPVLYAG